MSEKSDADQISFVKENQRRSATSLSSSSFPRKHRKKVTIDEQPYVSKQSRRLQLLTQQSSPTEEGNRAESEGEVIDSEETSSSTNQQVAGTSDQPKQTSVDAPSKTTFPLKMLRQISRKTEKPTVLFRSKTYLDPSSQTLQDTLEYELFHDFLEYLDKPEESEGDTSKNAQDETVKDESITADGAAKKADGEPSALPIAVDKPDDTPAAETTTENSNVKENCDQPSAEEKAEVKPPRKTQFPASDPQKEEEHEKAEESEDDSSPHKDDADNDAEDTEEERSPNQAKEERSPNQAKEERSPNQAKEERSPNQAKEERSPNQAKEERSPNQAKEERSPNQTKEERSPNQTKEERSPNPTKEERSPNQAAAQGNIKKFPQYDSDGDSSDNEDAEKEIDDEAEVQTKDNESLTQESNAIAEDPPADGETSANHDESGENEEKANAETTEAGDGEVPPLLCRECSDVGEGEVKYSDDEFHSEHETDSGCGTTNDLDENMEEVIEVKVTKKNRQKKNKGPQEGKHKIHYSLIDTPYINVPLRNIYSQKVRKELDKQSKKDNSHRSTESTYCHMCGNMTDDTNHAVRANLRFAQFGNKKKSQNPKFYTVKNF